MKLQRSVIFSMLPSSIDCASDISFEPVAFLSFKDSITFSTSYFSMFSPLLILEFGIKSLPSSYSSVVYLTHLVSKLSISSY